MGTAGRGEGGGGGGGGGGVGWGGGTGTRLLGRRDGLWWVRRTAVESGERIGRL